MHSYCTAYKIEMSAPDDVSQLEELLDRKEFDAGEIVCIICKSEGNGRVNDFS